MNATDAIPPICPNDGTAMTKSSDGTKWVCPSCGYSSPVKPGPDPAPPVQK